MKFLITPENASYAVDDSAEAVLRTQLDGGAGRYRADILNVSKIVNVTWKFDPTEYNYFEAFFRTIIAEGSLPFTIDLIIGSSALTTYTARFIPKTKKLTGQQGLTHYVGAQLEVEVPFNAGTEAADEATVDAFNDSMGYTP